MRFNRSLRYQLTIWYCVALVMGLIVFGVVLSGMAQQHLLTNHDANMKARGQVVLGILAGQGESRNLTPGQVEELAHISRVLVVERIGHVDQVVYRSPDIPGGALSQEIRGLPWQSETGRSFETLTFGGDKWRVYSLRYTSPIGRKGSIRIVENLGDVGATLKRLRVAFLHLAPVGILISFLGGFLLSARALAPLNRIIGLARRIEASKLDQRLPHPGVDDEIGRLVDTLNRMIARLEASFEAMKRFTADASHELRSPLATIRNTIDVTLEQPRTPQEQESAMRSIGEEVDRIRTLVEDLLLLARADAGRMVMQMKPVRLDGLVEAQVDAHQIQAREHDIQLECAPLPPDEILGDERWLHQVVGNLLDNAIKYTPMGGRVWVDLHHLVQDSTARITVSDSGPGIPEADLERVFERFFRSDPSRSRAHVPGLGLGLAIAAWVVHAHSGSIHAANRPGGGATFTVALPVGGAGGGAGDGPLAGAQA